MKREREGDGQRDSPESRTWMMFWMVAVMMREPPAAPMARWRVWSGYSMMVGDMDESGRLPGRMKFAFDGTVGC